MNRRHVIQVTAALLTNFALLRTSHAAPAASTDEIFKLLFLGLGLSSSQKLNRTPILSEFDTAEVKAFVDSFPIEANEVFVPTWEYTIPEAEPNHKFLQSNHGKFLMVFSFGNERDKWTNRLFSVSISIRYPNSDFQDENTQIFKGLLKKFGPYQRTDFFRHSNGARSEDTQQYFWKLPQVVFVYWIARDAARKTSTIVLQLWSREFFDTHAHYKY